MSTLYNFQVCCPPPDVVLFPDEFEKFSSYVFKESSATSGGPEYNYDYGDTDDYEETIYPQCPHNCVRHSFCNLTGRFLLYEFQEILLHCCLLCKSANSDYNTYIFHFVPNSTNFFYFQSKLILVCLLNPILCK